MEPVSAAQDSLRPVRNFVSLLSGAMNDQTYAQQDAYAINYANQFGVQGPNGLVVEGKPVIVSTAGQPAQAVGFPPLLMVGGLVLVAFMLLK